MGSDGSNCFLRVCSTMRSDELLSGNGYNEPTLSLAFDRGRSNIFVVGRFFNL